MKRQWLLLVALIMAGIAIGLVATEALIRLTGLATPPSVISANERQFARNPGVFVPRVTRTDRRSARFPHDITINSLGYRGGELAPLPTDRESRILFVGDSFTWGDLVDDHESLPAKLEEGLAEYCPGVRVVNAGVGGTTIDAHHAMVLRGLALEPDLVVLMFHDNDLADLSSPTFWEVMADNRRRKSQFPLSIVHLVLNRTATWTVMRQVATRLSNFRQPTVADRDDAYWEASLNKHREIYAGHLRSLAQDLRDRGVPFVMLSYPSHLRMLEATAVVDHAEWLNALTSELKVPFLDLLPVLEFSELDVEELFFVPWDGHARPVGYQIASMRAAEELTGLDSALRWCSR